MKKVLIFCILLLASPVLAGINEDISSLQPGSWYAIPNSRLKDAGYDWSPNPEPTNNSIGLRGIMSTWSGAAYDPIGRRLLVHGGGHNAYGGNEIYAFNFDSASNSFSWEMVVNPSAYGDIVANIQSERLLDGKPAAAHTNNFLIFSALWNAFVRIGAAGPYPSGYSGTSNFDVYDFDTDSWSSENVYPDSPAGYGHQVIAYNPNNGHIFSLNEERARLVHEYDPQTNSWTRRTGSKVGDSWFQYISLKVDPDNNYLIAVGRGFYFKWDISSYDENGYISLVSSSSSGPQNVVNAGHPTLDYDSRAKKMVSWLGGKDVYTLDTATDTWTRVYGNYGSYSPPSPTPNGVNGRWSYVPSLNVFSLATDIEENVWVYKHSPDIADKIAPSITEFLVPKISTTQHVSILSFMATDNIGVTGFMITETSDTPNFNDPKWLHIKPKEYAVANNGVHTLYAWTKDLSGNISSYRSATVEVSADFIAPNVTSFDLPSTSMDMVLNVLAYTASDNTGVVGYLINESANIPNTDDPGWSGTPPLKYTVSGSGTVKVYAWAKDKEGNISTSWSDTVEIIISYTAGALIVGPYQQYKTVSEAINDAQDGDIIEIDGGTYEGDVARINQNNITIRGIGGRAHLKANGANIAGKGIWVVSGNNVTIENIEFSGATVSDKNGAGIRSEGIGLTVRNCYFHDNENGILGGTWDSDIIIENCEFNNNGIGDGYTHNVYIGKAKTLTFRYNYSHHSKIGHNLKSRAEMNFIFYNRLMDEQSGSSSFSIDLPNGGTAYVIGNLLQQGPYGDNWSILSYGTEGLIHSGKDLYVVNNTFVNDRGDGRFVNLAGGASAKLINNIFVGAGTVLYGNGETITNLVVDNNPGFVNAANYDYRLTESSPAIDAGSDPGIVNGVNLIPVSQYLHPISYFNRTSVGVIDIGAYEFGNSPGSTVQPFAPTNLRVVID